MLYSSASSFLFAEGGKGEIHSVGCLSTACSDERQKLHQFLKRAYPDKDSTPPIVKREIKNGNFQVVFTSPECLYLSMEWKNMLLSNVYQQNLIGFVVDEAHCIKI